jgi:alpha-glucosidase
MLGLTINRDEVRTPMQWNDQKHAGFSSAEETWLPVHENYDEINVEKENKENDSLLNTTRGLLNIRNQEKVLREGSLELINNLPMDVLGFTRKLETENISVFLNFSNSPKEFQVQNSKLIFQLSEEDKIKDGYISLRPLSGVISVDHKS